MLRDCAGRRGGITLFLHAQERPQSTAGIRQVPGAVRYRPAGRSFPGHGRPPGERRGGRAPIRPRAEAPQEQPLAVPPLPPFPRGPRGGWGSVPPALALPPARPRSPAALRELSPALPGGRAEQSGDRQRKTGRKYGSCRLPALRLDLAA